MTWSHDHTGVFHNGFDSASLGKAMTDAGFPEVRELTAASVVKTTAEGASGELTVFLITG